jgi:hypothetical protein
MYILPIHLQEPLRLGSRGHDHRRWRKGLYWIDRSILADPHRSDMREIINTKIKFREKFRPFAPSILEEALEEYFIGAVPDPFMIQVYSVRPEKRGRSRP